MCESEIEMNEGKSEWMPQLRRRMWTRKSTNKVLLGSGRKGEGRGRGMVDVVIKKGIVSNW